jgi:hypothetical protein
MNVPSLENYPIVDNATAYPLVFKVLLTSTNPNVSPVVDLQQLSSYVVSNVINNVSSSNINVAEIDTRVLLTQGDIANSDIEVAGTGTITSSTSTNLVYGVSTVFKSQVFAGNKIYKQADNTLVGTVLSVQDDGTFTLTSNALQDTTGGSFYIRSTASLVFENNSSGFAVIRTNIDTADNLLASAGIGKVLTIQNVASGIDGTYTVRDIQVIEDTSLYAGNVERDVIRVVLEGTFSTTATIDMITDPDFTIKIMDKYVSDTAPYGCTNYSNYITRTLSLTQPAEIVKVMMDANIVNNTQIKVYYRTWTGDVDTRKLRWNDTGFDVSAQDSDGKFIEREVTVTDIPSFNNIQIKIVFKSSNPVNVPKVKNLRLLALS